jgi:DNA repair exonuclease SbcCD nuclease subunit
MKLAIAVAILSLSSLCWGWNCPSGQIRQQAPAGTPTTAPYYDVVEGIAFICVPSTSTAPTSVSNTNTNSINALQELIVNKYDFIVYDKHPCEWMFDGTKILMLPWICDENREESLHAIKTSSAQIVMGHLELQGYEMFKGHKSTHGDDPKLFDRFDCVFSGHFHTKSNSGNIFYLGSPSQYTWSDYGDERGFHIFDTETRELEFFRNRSSVFRKVFYKDTESDLENIVNFDPQEYAGCFVKIIVQNKTNPYWFDMFIDKIEKAGVSNLKVVEDHLNLNITEDEDLVNEAEDTLTILKKYVGGMTINDKKRLANNIFFLGLKVGSLIKSFILLL